MTESAQAPLFDFADKCVYVGSSSFNTARVDHLYQDSRGRNVRFLLRYGDMMDSTKLVRFIQDVQPTEIYNPAAQSHVQVQV